MLKKPGINPLVFKYEDAFEDAQMRLCSIIRETESAPVLEDLYSVRNLMDDMLEIFYEIGGIKL